MPKMNGRAYREVRRFVVTSVRFRSPPARVVAHDLGPHVTSYDSVSHFSQTDFGSGFSAVNRVVTHPVEPTSKRLGSLAASFSACDIDCFNLNIALKP